MNSSKNFKSIKNLSMNTKKIENNNNGNHNRYDNESDEKLIIIVTIMRKKNRQILHYNMQKIKLIK